MKKSHYILISAAVTAICITAACARRDNTDEMREERGRRQVLSGKNDVEDTTPAPQVEETTYLMRLENKTLTLYEIKDGEENAVKAVNIEPSYYPSEDIKELNKGIYAYSKEDGYIRMENFTN